MQIKGVLCSGIQQGSHFTQLDWVREQCNNLLGFIPHPGTLNLKVEKVDLQLWQILRQDATGLMVNAPTQEFCSARLFPGSLTQLNVAAVVPLVAGYPEDLIEILAPVPLRQHFNLIDGDSITIAFFTKKI